MERGRLLLIVVNLLMAVASRGKNMGRSDRRVRWLWASPFSDLYMISSVMPDDLASTEGISLVEQRWPW